MKVLRQGALVVALVGAGCASTQVTGSWKEPSLQSDYRPKNVLVVADVSPAHRQQLERELCSRLASEGMKCTPADQLIPRESKPTREQVEQVVRANDFDAVLVSAFRGVSTDTHFTPDVSYYSYYDAWSYPYYGVSTGTMHVTEKVKMETSLFEADRGQKIWTVTTSTIEPGDVSAEIPKVVNAVVNRMERDGLT